MYYFVFFITSKGKHLSLAVLNSLLMRLFIDSAGGMRPRAERKAYDT